LEDVKNVERKMKINRDLLELQLGFWNFFFSLLIAVSNRGGCFFWQTLQSDRISKGKLWLSSKKSTHFSGSESIYLNCIQFNEESKNRSPESDSRHLFIHLPIEGSIETSAVCGEEEKLIKCILRACTSWKMSWISRSDVSWKLHMFDSAQEWNPNAIEMSHGVVKFPVHQCTFVCDSFHSSYASHACENISGGFYCSFSSPSQVSCFSLPYSTCWVMLRIFPLWQHPIIAFRVISSYASQFPRR
jgi:hypothetical protein